MKREEQICYQDKINQMREELNKLVENEQLNSCIVQRKSQELDELILLYYKQNQELFIV